MGARGPIYGGELVAVIQGGQRVWANRDQVKAILAAQDMNPAKPSGNAWIKPTGDEAFSAIQGGERVSFTIADISAWLATTPTAFERPPGRGMLTTITGAELLPIVSGGVVGFLDVGDAIAVGVPTGGAAVPVFASTAHVRIVLDSLWGSGTTGASPGTGQLERNTGGIAEVALAESPRFRLDNYPKDTTAYQGADKPYGLPVRYTDGGQGSTPGAPFGYALNRSDFSVSTGAKVEIVGISVNSRDLPQSSAIPNMMSLIDKYIAAGAFVIAQTMPPVNQGGTYDDTNYQANHLALNASLRATVAARTDGKIRVLDWSKLMDPGLTGYCTYPALSGLPALYDTIHPDDWFVSVMADFFNAETADLFTGPDLFDWRWANLPNLLPNPIFNSADTGLLPFTRNQAWATGSVGPRGFRGDGDQANALSNVVTTMTPNAETGGNMIQFPINLTASSTNLDGFSFKPLSVSGNTTGLLKMPALGGKWVVFAAEVEVPAGAYFATPFISCSDDATSTTRYSRYMSRRRDGRRRSKAQKFKLMTDAVYITPGSDGPRCTVSVRILGADAWAAGLTTLPGMLIRRAALYEVPDPRILYNDVPA